MLKLKYSAVAILAILSIGGCNSDSGDKTGADVVAPDGGSSDTSDKDNGGTSKPDVEKPDVGTETAMACFNPDIWAKGSYDVKYVNSTYTIDKNGVPSDEPTSKMEGSYHLDVGRESVDGVNYVTIGDQSNGTWYKNYLTIDNSKGRGLSVMDTSGVAGDNSYTSKTTYQPAMEHFNFSVTKGTEIPVSSTATVVNVSTPESTVTTKQTGSYTFEGMGVIKINNTEYNVCTFKIKTVVTNQDGAVSSDLRGFEHWSKDSGIMLRGDYEYYDAEGKLFGKSSMDRVSYMRDGKELM